MSNLSGYVFSSTDAAHTNAYLLPAVHRAMEQFGISPGTRLFEIGCGNGATAAYLNSVGYDITGIDPSSDGIKIANSAYPNLNLYAGSTEEDLRSKYGLFDAVLSLEVVEHVYSPKLFAERVRSLLMPGGIAIISTPYHGYAKNLALALSGKLDGHFTALWEGGHIKFWSRRTLGELFRAVSMREARFERVGRVPLLAKSMVCVYEAP